MTKIQAKAFFFDFDGVVVDSEKLHMISALKTSQNHGIEFTEEFYFDKLLGFDDVGLFEYLWKENSKNLTKEELQNLIQKKNEEFLKALESEIIFFDGVKSFIKSIHQAKIPMAIVSGALQNEIQKCLEIGHLKEYFQFIIAADDVLCSKPDPESYQMAFDGMKAIVPNLTQDDVWVIEDSPAGIHSAKGAHLNVIGITNSLKRAFLTEANLIVDHYKEVEITKKS